MHHRITFSFIFFFIVHISFAQDRPGPRASGHLFYFNATQSLILIDGYEKGTTPAKAETWAWKSGWNKTDITDQPLRSLSAAAYLPDKKEIFVFGGVGSRGYEDSLRDAWIYNGKEWKKITGTSIGTRDHHEMVYDENNHSIIVYGGQTGNRGYDLQTWIFRKDQWTALNIPGPGQRVHHAMAYDPVRKKTVLFGGFAEKSSPDDTWEFDGQHWAKISTVTNPGARGHHAMVYDPSRKKVLLYGGDADWTIKGDVWAWDGKNWEKLSDNGPARILSAVAFNPQNNKLYVFGGNGGDHATKVYSDLWEWDGKIWTQIEKGKVYKWDNQKDMFVLTDEQ